jgi:CysZ protein
LPLWFFPPLWPVLPILLFAYLNQRVFRYDALAEHATGCEMETLIRRHRRELFLLGVALALFGLIPLLGFLAPVYGGLAFIHYCLARLAQLREEPVATQ